MVSQDFENAATRGVASTAFLYHTLQFRAQSFKAGHPLLDLFQLPPRNFISFVTRPVWLIGKLEQLADRLQREAQLPGVPDKSQAVEFGFTITSLSACGSTRFGHQTDLLIVPDRLYLGSGLLCERADREHVQTLKIL